MEPMSQQSVAHEMHTYICVHTRVFFGWVVADALGLFVENVDSTLETCGGATSSAVRSQKPSLD